MKKFVKMKKSAVLLSLFAAVLCTGEEIDIYETGRYDFDRDGIPEQIVITSGGGSGGPIWYIARLNGEKLSSEIQGSLYIMKTKFMFPDLLVTRNCGANERHLELYRFNTDFYKCIQHKIIDLSKHPIK